MKKNFIFKFLISAGLLLFANITFAKENTFVSLSPALTEIMYSINAQDSLKGVSTACTYPNEARQKEKIGDNFFLNTEKILSIKPDYILALDSSAFMLERFKRFNITPLCFKYPNIETIYQNILQIGSLSGKEQNAQSIVKKLKNDIKNSNKNHNSKILYLVQTYPMISIGNKSFITDIIEKSGNISVTKNLNSFYPAISEEYAIEQNPDVIILSFYSDTKRIRKLFPNSKIVILSEQENDIINRPGTRINLSVRFFSQF